jgi:hypothetical protein
MCLTLSIGELCNIGVYMYPSMKCLSYTIVAQGIQFFYWFLLDNQIKNTNFNGKLTCLSMFPTPLPLSGGGVSVIDFKGM